MSTLRERVLRGTVVTAAFLIGIDAIVLVQGLVVTKALGPAQVGLYGMASATAMSLVAFKRIGVDEAFIAQREADQRREFEQAFTLDLIASLLVAGAIAAAAPLVALAFGDGRALGLTASLAWLPVAFALLAPLWIFHRRMDYVRQRSLQAIQPLLTCAVTVTLALTVTSLGAWCIVIGLGAGYVASIAAAVAASPMRLALRWEGAVARRYIRFSVPILGTVVAALVIAQGQVLAFKLHGGLAAAGFITLAVTFTRYIDRADQIVAATIYPAICELQGHTRALVELFRRSNRATLLWVLPASGAIVLFAPDLVRLVLGARWDGAIVLLQGLAIATALQQIGFNWFSFHRAAGLTVPTAVEALTGAGAFLVLAILGLAVWGADGFVAGRCAAVCCALVVRRRYLRALLPQVSLAGVVAPMLVPLAIATGTVVALRAALWGGSRPAGQAAGEVVLFCVVYCACAWRLARPLVADLLQAFNGRRSATHVAVSRSA